MNEPIISHEEAKAIVETKTAPRVTEQAIKDKIKQVEFFALRQGDGVSTGTLCVITMRNGWVSTGFAAAASSENYDEEVGKRYSYDHAFRPLWQLEGYLLKESLAMFDDFAQAAAEDVAQVAAEEEAA